MFHDLILDLSPNVDLYSQTVDVCTKLGFLGMLVDGYRDLGAIQRDW